LLGQLGQAGIFPTSKHIHSGFQEDSTITLHSKKAIVRIDFAISIQLISMPLQLLITSLLAMMGHDGTYAGAQFSFS
jgi:hypothetical protein